MRTFNSLDASLLEEANVLSVNSGKNLTNSSMGFGRAMEKI